jgi:hypothetical protein
MKTLLNIGKFTIPQVQEKLRVIFQDGTTEDIISTIIKADRAFYRDTQNFAKHLKGNSRKITAFNAWRFVRNNIKYVLDPFGVQMVKRPARTFFEGQSDCKSYSLFLGSIFKNLNIPYAYRFVSFSESNTTVTHVYVVVYDKDGSEILVDACLSQFNYQKEFKHKIDKPMTKILIGGLEQENVVGNPLEQESVIGELDFGANDMLTEGAVDLAIAKQRVELMQDVVQSVSGIGSAADEKLQSVLDVIEDAQEIISGPESEEEMEDLIDDVEDGEYDSDEIMGIGDIGKRKDRRKKKKARRKLRRKKRRVVRKKKKVRRKVRRKKRRVVRKKGVRKVLRRVKRGAKKALKGAARLTTAPARFAFKKVLQVTLPATSMYFAYLFVNEPKLISKLPVTVRKKRAKSASLANFIVGTSGLKRSQFMGIIRNGILKKTRMQPERYLSKQLGYSIRGTEEISGIVVSAAVVIKLINVLSSLFKKKGPKISSKDVPDPSGDFKGLSAAAKKDLGSGITKQKVNDPSSLTNMNTGGRKLGFCGL